MKINQVYSVNVSVYAEYVMLWRFTPCVCVWNKDGEGAKELESLHSEKLKVVQLDVCSEEQVSQAFQFVTANLDDPEKGEGCLAHRGWGVQRSFRRTRPP